eukprot:COSAG02_NODE_59068_length_275_cov_0.863636_1_plen_30_part_01
MVLVRPSAPDLGGAGAAAAFAALAVSVASV